MVSHPFDFEIQADIFSTPDLKAVFSEKKRFSRWLAFEAALAETQGELGIIPSEAAQEIKRRATIDAMDFTAMAEAYRTGRNSLMPLIKSLRLACDNGAGEYVHYGATTQDVLDTGQIMELRDALKIIYRDLRGLEDAVFALASRYADTPMIARTHGQQALPITFGFKCSVWLGEIRRHLERLKNIVPRLLTGQLSGAVGSMAALGDQGREVAERTLKKLGLRPATITWHTSRDIIAETSSWMALVTATLEKIANEVFELGKTETGEICEPAPTGAVSSSTMPHKRNPVISQRIAVMARQVRALNLTVIEAMVHEHERDGRSLWSEWLAIPQIAIYTGTACYYSKEIMSNLEVRPNRMLQNLKMYGDMVLSEWLLFRLGPDMGKMRAQEKLHHLIDQAVTSEKSLKNVILQDSETSSLLRKEDLAFLDHPEKYLGLVKEIIRDLLDEVSRQRETDPEVLC
ncbi:MAG: adenylosuccinate lyase family protein [Proteobacteria bacterium]|nr:adenylosuccinate lyase family protein [Pseudomonadota bacterium]MBU1688652.1 adenylosuccinate lyase family protein [Pseudomonadota bacterium]